MRKGIELVGEVIELSRNPVKGFSTDEESRTREQVELRKSRVSGDRRVAFFLSNLTKFNGFPWVTARMLPDMLKYVASFVDPNKPDESAIRVLTPEGEELDVMDPRLVQAIQDKLKVQKRYEDAEVGVIPRTSGLQDSMPLSLLSRATLDAVSSRIGTPIPAQQFRMNIIIDTAGKQEGDEDDWVGSLIRVGDREDSPVLAVVEKDSRCIVVNHSPMTANVDPRVLKEIGMSRRGNMGVYASVVQTGHMRQGDKIYLQRVNW